MGLKPQFGAAAAPSIFGSTPASQSTGFAFGQTNQSKLVSHNVEPSTYEHLFNLTYPVIKIVGQIVEIVTVSVMIGQIRHRKYNLRKYNLVG